VTDKTTVMTFIKANLISLLSLTLYFLWLLFIVFDFNKKVYSQEFEYKPFSMAADLDEVQRGDLVFDLEGLEKEEYLHVSATDTSFTSRDIVEIDTLKNGKLVIPAHKLRYLVNGPITLLLSKETQKIIKNEIHGRVTVSYGLKREFELTSGN